MQRPTSYSSSRPRRSTPAMWGMSEPWRTSSGFDDATLRHAGMPLLRSFCRTRRLRLADEDDNRKREVDGPVSAVGTDAQPVHSEVLLKGLPDAVGVAGVR